MNRTDKSVYSHVASIFLIAVHFTYKKAEVQGQLIPKIMEPRDNIQPRKIS